MCLGEHLTNVSTSREDGFFPFIYAYFDRIASHSSNSLRASAAVSTGATIVLPTLSVDGPSAFLGLPPPPPPPFFFSPFPPFSPFFYLELIYSYYSFSPSSPPYLSLARRTGFACTNSAAFSTSWEIGKVYSFSSLRTLILYIPS